MLLISLLLIPVTGIFTMFMTSMVYEKNYALNLKFSKIIALTASTVNLFVSLIVFIIFNFSSNQFQFVQEYHNISNFDFYLGVDGLSVYFVILTTIIMPISLLSNWSSISESVIPYLIIILLLETLLLAIFTVLDMFLFYIFFESILPPLFLLIGIFGSSNRVRAGFYLFLYTLLGSLFMLLSILQMSYITGNTDFDAIYKTNFSLSFQMILFIGIFIAFAVKTPTIFLNTWLLKAHVESPLGGSIILAGIVLKLSLYGIFRLILALLPQANVSFTYIVYTIGVITILYASLSTLRTIDVKELIAYSSVSHAAVYILGVFSNTIQGIVGGIVLGLAHGFVSSGLFICAGGALYDRSSTRLITVYRGMAQIMPLFSILFFVLCLGNSGTPLSLNFIGEFMSLYGTFERISLAGIFASSSIVFSAAYTMYMFNRIAFGGSFTKSFMFNVSDLSRREFYILFPLVMLTVIFGIYPSVIIDGLNYSVSLLIYDTSLHSIGVNQFTWLLFPVSFKDRIKSINSDNMIIWVTWLIGFTLPFTCLRYGYGESNMWVVYVLIPVLNGLLLFLYKHVAVKDELPSISNLIMFMVIIVLWLIIIFCIKWCLRDISTISYLSLLLYSSWLPGLNGFVLTEPWSGLGNQGFNSSGANGGNGGSNGPNGPNGPNGQPNGLVPHHTNNTEDRDRNISSNFVLFPYKYVSDLDRWCIVLPRPVSQYMGSVAYQDYPHRFVTAPRRTDQQYFPFITSFDITIAQNQQRLIQPVVSDEEVPRSSWDYEKIKAEWARICESRKNK